MPTTLIWAAFVAIAADGGGRGPALPVMLQIDWRRLPDVPAQGPEHQGFQDSDGGWIDDDTVVTAFGYAAGGVPGFLNTGYWLNVTSAAAAAAATLAAATPDATGCSYEFPGNKCPASEPAVRCSTTPDCRLAACPGGCTCHGVVASCNLGLCTAAGAILCSSPVPPPAPPPVPPPVPPPPTPWHKLPDAPVSGRQEVGATLVDGGTALVYVGGFSYSAPYSFNDAVMLKWSGTQDLKWAWSTLPSLPYAVSSMGVASIGTQIFVVGGADYDGQAFSVFTDRRGGNAGFGKHLLILDLRNLSAGWQRGPDLPGSPRWVHSVTAVGGEVYVIGGATTNATVVDNWRFDPVRRRWAALPDLPISSGNFQTNGNSAFGDRYIVLVGGYQYKHVYHPSNGSYGAPYGQARRMCPDVAVAANASGCRAGCAEARSGIVNKPYMGEWSDEYNNDVLVFDTATSTFGRARGVSTGDPALMPEGCGDFPMNDNLPQVNVRGSKIFSIGGECDDRVIGGTTYTHYPRFSVVGDISVV